MRYHAHLGELPLGAFEHCGDGKIKPQGGGIPIVSDVVDFVGGAVEDVGGFVGDAVEDVGGFVGDTVSGVGDTVGAFVEDPVGFLGNVVEYAGDNPLKTAAILAAANYAPQLLAEFAPEIAAAEFAALDAANLAAQGLTESQIASTLAASGVEGFVAADAAALASQGLSSQQIASGLSQSISGSSGFTTLPTDFPTIGDQPGDYPMSGGYGNPTAPGVQEAAKNLLDYNAAYATGGIGMTDALRLANQANSLLSPQQQPQQGQMPMLQQAGATAGAVDYSGLLGLLQTKAKRPDILNLLG